MRDSLTNKPVTRNLPTPQIYLKNIHLYLGDTHALRGLSWKMGPGESWAILGKNGAGKSALLKLLSGDVYPVVRRGSEFSFNGHDRFKPGYGLWDLRRQVGVVSPELQAQYLTDTTGLEVVLSGFHGSNGLYQKPTNKERKKALRLMEGLGVGALEKRRMGAISYGQARKLLIARALVHDPRVLVLDEPTHGLDLPSAEDFLETLADQVRRGRSLVIVTHHLHEIIPAMTHVAFLDRGKITAQGEKDRWMKAAPLSKFFGLNLQIHRTAGRYWALPCP